MTNKISAVKRILDTAISQLCDVSWMFTKSPGRDFTRSRKLPFREVISLLLSMEGGTLTAEMLKHFGCSADIASTSAFVQQRGKISEDAVPSLFDLFVQKTDTNKLYKGLRLIAADGSEIQIPTNPNDLDSYYPGSNGQSPYNLLHLTAMYDLLSHTYTYAHLLGKRKANERAILCSMVDRSSLDDVLLIADRGYENYNLMAHIQEKGWFFLIRIQDVSNSRGIAVGLDLPNSEEFDFFVDLSLVTKQTNELKKLCKNRNQYKHIHKDFDYLPKINRKHDPTVFYNLFDAASAGCPVAAEVIKRYTGYVAAGVINVMRIFQPEAVILGGAISKKGDNLLLPIRKRCILPVPIELKISELKNDAGLLGAAALAKEAKG